MRRLVTRSLKAVADTMAKTISAALGWQEHLQPQLVKEGCLTIRRDGPVTTDRVNLELWWRRDRHGHRRLERGVQALELVEQILQHPFPRDIV